MFNANTALQLADIFLGISLFACMTEDQHGMHATNVL